MVVTLLNKLRTFNTALLDTTPFTVRFSGFENAPLGRLKPFEKARKEIGSDGVAKTKDVVNRGDIRVAVKRVLDDDTVEFRQLTAAELVTVNRILDDHDDTVDTARQVAGRIQQGEIDTLKTLHDSGIDDTTVALIARIVLRESGKDV